MKYYPYFPALVFICIKLWYNMPVFLLSAIERHPSALWGQAGNKQERKKKT